MSSYKERLLLFKSIYGENVLCTNGLFHIIDNKHGEIYINRNTGEIDKRGKYKTIAVLDKIIISKVINDVKIKYVVLKKNNLECIHKSTSEICYLNNNLVYDKQGAIISHTGKILIEFDKIASIKELTKRYFIVKTGMMYQDKFIEYIEQSDKLKDLTKDKNYIIEGNNKQLHIYSMSGGNYKYMLDTHECFNEFTLEKEDTTQIWSIK